MIERDSELEPAPDAPCGNCDGRGTITEDRFGRRGHFTVETPCPECRPDEYARRLRR